MTNPKVLTETPLLYVGESDARWTLILAHGAGQGMHSPFMQAFADGLHERGGKLGGIRVVRFEFPYMTSEKKRPPDRQPVLLATYAAVLETLRATAANSQRLVIGGKSLGGRIASMIADQQNVAGLCCLGYPFHPPGKPDRTRTEHLENIKTPTLICQGERDPFGTVADVAGYSLSPRIQMAWLADGDHGFKPRKASGRTEAQNWNAAMDSISGFLSNLDGG